jgi:type III restriction enzyme
LGIVHFFGARSRWNGEHPECQPDFVAETEKVIYMLEPKMRIQMTDKEVLEKQKVAVQWCQHASHYIQQHGGKSWRYVLIPHDAIAENMTLAGLLKLFAA